MRAVAPREISARLAQDMQPGDSGWIMPAARLTQIRAAAIALTAYRIKWLGEVQFIDKCIMIAVGKSLRENEGDASPTRYAWAVGECIAYLRV